MTNHSTDQLTLPENVRSMSGTQRSWNGVRVHVTDFHCEGEVIHELPYGGETRLSVLLDEVGGHCEPRLRKHQRCPIEYMPGHMTFAPASLGVWGYGADLQTARDAMLVFDVGSLEERLSTSFPAASIDTLRLRFVDPEIWTLVNLLSKVVDDIDPSAQLYGDGLTTAIAARLLGARELKRPESSKGLAPYKLRRVLEYLNEHLPERVELKQLATFAGMSQAHFSRAFKASTGMAPYHWQLDARIRGAQGLLLKTSASLDEVASAMGFADGVHFGRTFRRFTGRTPAEWRRNSKI